MALKPGLAGVHPRLFFGSAEVEAARASFAANPRAFGGLTPDPGGLASLPASFSTGVDSQLDNIARANSDRVGQLAIAYALTQSPRYRRALARWTPLLRSYKPVSYDEPNGDLVSGHVLIQLAASYDLLRGRIDPAFEDALHAALCAEARNAFRSLEGRSQFHYEQNHFTIPVSGLAVASLALDDETEETRLWRTYSVNLFKRCLGVLSPDGWYFEGSSYWTFAMQYLVQAAAAVKATTGCDLFAVPPLCNAPVYLAHILLPDPNYVFDFCDWGPRVQPDGTALPGYEVPWHALKTRFILMTPRLIQWERPSPLLGMFIRSEEAVAHDQRTGGLFRAFLPGAGEPAAVAAGGLPDAPPYHYFDDMGVVHWRNRWLDPDATALAFKSGPPAGHRETRLLPLFPEWRPGLGHAHPDAGAFTLFAHGVFLANGGDGYTGRKQTANTNSILVDGVGQAREGTAWGTYGDRPYADYDKIRMEHVWLGPRAAAATAVFGAAYNPTLRIVDLRRQLVLIDGHFMVIHDSIDSEAPHTYTWLLHGDRRAAHPRPNRFVMENGPGRLVIDSLLPYASFEIAPTIVETQVFEGRRSRPKQHGYHVALHSGEGLRHCEYLVAMDVQSARDSADSFAARLLPDGSVEMADGAGSCTVRLERTAGLRTAFGYVLRDDKGTVVSRSGGP